MTLEEKLNYDRIKTLSRELSIDSNHLLCGYLRQPLIYDGKEIKGYCVLKERNCHYKPPIDIEQCKIYELYFSKYNFRRK